MHKTYKQGGLDKEISMSEQVGKYFLAGYRARECGLFKKAIENFAKCEPHYKTLIEQIISPKELLTAKNIKDNEEFKESFQLDKELTEILNSEQNHTSLPEYLQISN